jgi:hypothetical protein
MRTQTERYNFNHFKTTQLVRDAARTAQHSGPAPGETAPDFQLPLAGGGSLQLSSLRGRPVLLHLGSFT